MLVNFPACDIFQLLIFIFDAVNDGSHFVGFANLSLGPIYSHNGYLSVLWHLFLLFYSEIIGILFRRHVSIMSFRRKAYEILKHEPGDRDFAFNKFRFQAAGVTRLLVRLPINQTRGHERLRR